MDTAVAEAEERDEFRHERAGGRQQRKRARWELGTRLQRFERCLQETPR